MADPAGNSAPRNGVEAPISSVLIMVAMDAEAAPIIDALGLTPKDIDLTSAPAPCRVFSGSHAGMTVHVAHNGKSDEYGVCRVGTNGATLATFLSVAALKPDLVISGGTAGGFKARGAEIASIFVSTECRNHDRHIPLPGYDKFGVESVPSHEALQLAEALGFKTGVVTTGNSLTYSEADMAAMQGSGAAVKEMEAAAVAAVCRDLAAPMFAIKAVTDLVDGEHPPQEEFLANLARAVAALTEAMTASLDWMSGKTLADL